MAIPEQKDSQDEQRRSFRRLHDLFIELRESHPGIDTLSAGMSGDLEAAIAEGSTMVRVGTALFGSRVEPLCSGGSSFFHHRPILCPYNLQFEIQRYYILLH